MASMGRLKWARHEGNGMILAPLAGVALVLSVATGPLADPTGSVLSVQQKNAAMQPLVRSATECIAQAVLSDERFRSHEIALGELIVESMNSCLGPVRAMIDGYDRYFGDGTGEAFFMGPYLDVLPAAVNKSAAERRE
jgi:hypothetical protein